MGCANTVGTALVLCDTDPLLTNSPLNASTGFFPTHNDSFYYHFTRNQNGDYHPYTQKLSTALFNTLKNNQSNPHPILILSHLNFLHSSVANVSYLHPYREGYAFIANGITVTNNVFEENVAWLSSGIISQGSYRATFDHNSFINGSVFNPDALLGSTWAKSPVSAILGLPMDPELFVDSVEGVTSQSPLFVKMANQVQITNCVFDGNKGSSSGDYWIGSAITLASLIGMSSPLIKNCTFQNHIGLWNQSTISSTSIYFGIYLTQNTEPLITVSFYGGNYEFNYTNNPSSTSQYHEDYIANATVILDSCEFINNTFNQTSSSYWISHSLYANHSFIVKGFVINETIDYTSYSSPGATLSTNFYPNYNPEGYPLQKLFLTIQNSQFINNTVYSPQPLFANTIFDQITITNSIFEGNTIATIDETAIMNNNTAMFVLSNDNTYRQSKDYQQILITDSQFINNSGPVLFTNYTASKESESLNTMILLQNLSFSDHTSRLPLFFFKKFSNANISSVYLNNTSVKNPVFVLTNINTPFLALDNITIDGVDNLQLQATDSFAIFQNQGWYSLCLALQNISNITVANISCLNSNFHTNGFYSTETIGACGHFKHVYSITIDGFTCSSATFQAEPDLISQQVLFLIEGTSQTLSSVNFTNLMLASNDVYQGFVITNALINFASNIRMDSNAFSYIGITLSISCEVNLTDAQVLNNVGSFISNHEGILRLSDSTFENNTALENTIVESFYGLLEIKNCTVTSNMATREGGLFRAGQAPFTIQDSIFQKNIMSRILIYSLNCDFSVTNSSFLQNKANATTGNLAVYLGSATIANITHQGCLSGSYTSRVQADFLYSSHAEVTLTDINSSFSDAAYGAILLNSGSKVTISNSQFSNGTGTYAGAIATGVSLTLNNCNFSGNQATRSNIGSASSVLALEGTSSLSISDILVEDAGGYSISASNISTIVVSSSVFQGSSLSSMTGGIEIISADSINLTNITISGMNATHGGGLYVTSPVNDNTQLYINSVNISNCTAEDGGAMYIKGVANASIESVILDSNQAYSSKPSKGYGGGIYYSATSVKHIFKIDSSVTFSNNFASKAGGALYYDTYKVSSLGNAVFDNNSATYGNDIGSYPISIGLITAPDPQLIEEFVRFVDPYLDYISEETIANLTKVDNGRLLDGSQPYSFTSGEIMFPPLVFASYDESNGMVGSDNTSTITVIPDPNFPWKNGSEPVFLKGSTFTAFKGHYIIYPLAISYPPNNSLSLTFIGKTSAQKAQEINSTGFLTSLTLDFLSKECLQGQRITHDNICVTCPAGYFIAEVNTNDDCIHCPEGKATCLGGNLVGPQTNYWRYNSESAVFYPCKSYGACLGSTITDPELRKTAYCKELYNETFCLTGWCSEMYGGNLCSICKDGYSLSSMMESDCTPCVKDWWLYAKTVFFGTLAILVVMAIVRGAIMDEDTYIKKKEAELKNPSLRRTKTRATTRKSKSRLETSPIMSLRKGPFGSSKSRVGLRPKIATLKDKIEAAVWDKLQAKKMMKTQLFAEPSQESQGIQKSDPDIDTLGGCLSPIPRIESSITPQRTNEEDGGAKVLQRTKKKMGEETGTVSKGLDSSSVTEIILTNFSPANLENLSNSKSINDNKEEPEHNKSPEKNKFGIASSELVQGVQAFKFLNLGGDEDGKDDPEDLDEAEVNDDSPKSNLPRRASPSDRGETVDSQFFQQKLSRESNEKKMSSHREPSFSNCTSNERALKIEELPSLKRESSKFSDPNFVRIGNRTFSREQILNRYSKNVNMVSSYTKILINFIQMVAIVQSYQLNWPEALDTFFQQYVKVYLVFLQFFNLDCLMKVTNISTLNTDMPDIFKKVLIYAFLPIVLSLLGVIFWFLTFVRRIAKEKTTKRAHLKECMYTRMIVTTIIICFFLHSSIMLITISTLK